MRLHFNSFLVKNILHAIQIFLDLLFVDHDHNKYRIKNNFINCIRYLNLVTLEL